MSYSPTSSDKVNVTPGFTKTAPPKPEDAPNATLFTKATRFSAVIAVLVVELA